MDLKFVINDNCDVCIRMRQKESHSHEHEEHHFISKLNYRNVSKMLSNLVEDDQKSVNYDTNDDHPHVHDKLSTIYLFERCNIKSKRSKHST